MAVVKVSCRKTSARFQDSVEERFVRFVGQLEGLYGVSLPIPADVSSASLKKFTSGLLEGGCHSWRPAISRLSSESRWSLAFSLFLFRKIIPSEAPQVGAYVEKMTTPQDLPDPGLLRFALREVGKLFPVGWDRSYLDKCSTSTLPTSSCYESGRKNGGCRGLDAHARWSREEFCSYVTESVAPKHRGASRVQAIETGGKWRVISIPPRIDNALRPLHQSMYDRLSKYGWLLRGDAKASRFRDFRHVAGEVFVSGDYESATDNLNSYLQLAIFHRLLGNATRVPDGIRSHALQIFSSQLECEGFAGQQARGQLMGQLTSFPLLCLVNYLTFKYSVPRDVPVKINGDDIVFRASPEESDAWFKNVEKGGLTVSRGKTLVDSRFFSLNSCLFKATAKKSKAVPFVRPKAVWSAKERLCEQVSSLRSRFNSFCPGFGRRKRVQLDTFFLCENSAAIRRCRRSLTRGMGMRVGRESLTDAGLWFRELFYLEKWSEPDLPAFSFSQMKCKDIPQGWQRVSRYRYPASVVSGWEARLAFELVRSAWSSDVLSDSDAEERWWSACDTGTDRYGMGFVTNRMAKLAGLSRRDLWKLVYFRRNESVFGRVRFTRGTGVLRPEPSTSSDVTIQDTWGSRDLSGGVRFVRPSGFVPLACPS
ncbi:RNA-dependent RNA polymerase [Erysiphe necator associated ourmia-like virus 125]|nr:RNA-dependent RNA polymerase [Erysiphe necator associated ourmia-like virus 125]